MATKASHKLDQQLTQIPHNATGNAERWRRSLFKFDLRLKVGIERVKEDQEEEEEDSQIGTDFLRTNQFIINS